jgi:glutamate dehydrogenase (NAD(P)+)
VETDVLAMMDEWGPEKVVCVSDRRTGMRGVLVVDNTARGTGKGGTRMSPTLTVGEVARLARTMTWKWAAVDLFHGGAKAGILGDPAGRDKEQVLRAFARALADHVPAEYVFGLDMGLSESDAAVLADELGDRGAAVGLPRELGGLPYDQLGVTGYGVAEAADAAAEVVGLAMPGSRVVLQGFGAVGAAAARRFAELGAVVVAVSTAVGAVHDPDGLDLDRLLRLRDESGDDCVRHYGRLLPAGDALSVPVDVLVPAATQDVVDEQVARTTQARLVVEGANMPTTRPALALLAARGVPVVPDFIANAGGVIAAALAMDARRSAFAADGNAAFPLISAKLRANAVTVLRRSADDGCTPHEAALRVAQERVLTAMRLRGRLPAAVATAPDLRPVPARPSARPVEQPA